MEIKRKNVTHTAPLPCRQGPSIPGNLGGSEYCKDRTGDRPHYNMAPFAALWDSKKRRAASECFSNYFVLFYYHKMWVIRVAGNIAATAWMRRDRANRFIVEFRICETKYVKNGRIGLKNAF